MCRFWHFVSQQPVRILEVPDDQTEQEPVQMEAPRFMAVVWGAGQDGDGPTTIVQLDGQGRLAVILLFYNSVGFLVVVQLQNWHQPISVIDGQGALRHGGV
jgi:hypothetical protein